MSGESEGRGPKSEIRKILVSGSTGLIGSALVARLSEGGVEVGRLVRPSTSAQDGVSWDISAGTIDADALRNYDAVVHLAGENIAAGRWTAAQKARIRDSRVDGTRLLAEALAGLDDPPGVFVCASAVGYYGDRGDEELDEESPAGANFLADVCREWEAAAAQARENGLRVVHARFGIVLSARGGALAQMLTPFKMGVGGVVGSGRQFMSWIALDDVVAALEHVLHHDELEGPVCCVAPHPVTNREFTKTLGRVLHRPTCCPMPAFAARLAFGQMADELLLASAKVRPRRLTESGFSFGFSDLEPALRHVLAR